MDVVIAIVAKIAEYTVAPIGSQLGYLIQYNSNIESLRAQVQSLKDAQHGNQGSVDEAERNGQVIRKDVQTWLTRVNAITAESDNFFNEEVNQNQRCSSFSSCPNLFLRHKVSRKAKKKKLVVDELLLKSNFNNGVAFAPPPPLIPECINVGDVEVFESRDETYNRIIQALKDDKTNIIGVYGMAGIGKTTLVKYVWKQLVNQHKLFDKIAMAVVSQTPSITKIQDEIASMLGLQLHESENILIRADRLCKSIKNSKQILVILDDLWTMLDLNEIGIPHADVHKGCKILLTTREHDVCVEMQSQIFPIGILSESEAWNLFRKTAGDVVDSSDLKPIATEVAKECAGLPLCIVTIAGTLMKVKDLSGWRNALLRLQNPSTKTIKGMNAKVYSSLKLSYDFIDDEEEKYCFLLCCLAGEDSDIRINNLVGLGMGLGIFDDRWTLPNIIDAVRASVNELKGRCLLLEGNYVDCVRMHDVVRDFAISVVSEVQHGSWARLDNNIISTFNNEKFDYSTLKMLFLQSNDDTLVIPDKFFERMNDLRVLSMYIPTLPSSVLFLVNLRTLYLEDCSVEDISFIGKLKCLEILSFVRCRIQELPRDEIEQLKRLRVLELSECVGLKVIPAGVISSLSQLEGLYMYMSLVDWGKDSNASLVELNGLPYLKTIDMHLPDVKLFPKDLHLKSLSEFKISLGTEFSSAEWNDSFVPAFDGVNMFNEVDQFNVVGGFKCLYPRMLKVGNIDQSISSHDGVKMLVNQAESLIIENFELDSENILSELKREGFSRLKCLKVVKNQKTKYLVDTMKEKIFPVLEGLKLKNMENLMEICRGRLPSGSFCELCELELKYLHNLQNMWVGNASLLNLRVVKIRGCGSLKNLFSQNIVSGFGQLSSLKVENCQNIEEILAYDEAIEEVEIEFSKFKILKLTRLPNLTTFYSKRRNPISDGSVDVPPPIQKALFCEKIAFPKLEELGVSGKFEEIWPQNIPSNSFCRLRVLDIGVFHKIKTAIPSNLVPKLQNLEELRVDFCELVEEVVEELEEEEPSDHMKIVLPRLKRISLYDLQKLVRFCNGNCTLDLPLLKDLTINWCPKLETLFMSSGCEGKESRTASSSNNAPNMTEGFNREVQSLFNEKVLLPSLERLNIRNCESLRNVLTPSIAKDLSSLTVIIIESCSSLEVVVAEEDQRQEICMRPEEEEENKIIITVFPQLRKLSLYGLDQLKCLYNGHCKLEFPSLATLRIKDCEKIETIFGSASNSTYGGGYNKSAERRKQSYDEVGSTTSNAKMDIDTMIPPMLFSEQVLLPSLRKLDIDLCECLRNVLTPSIVKVLSSLTRIEIGWCSSLEVVIAEEDQRQEICMRQEEEENKIIITVFPQLSHLRLRELPQLKCLYNGHCKLEFPSLTTLRIEACRKIETIFGSASNSYGGYNNSTKRRKMEVEDIDNMIPPVFFSEQVLLPNLANLAIDGCDSLRNLLTPSIVKAFSCLKVLRIKRCCSLEQVVREEDQRIQVSDQANVIVFPQLRHLLLYKLLKLKCFYNGHCKLEFPSLVNVYIRGCPRIETIFTSDSYGGYNKSTERRKQSYDQVGSSTSNAKMDEDDMHVFDTDEYDIIDDMDDDDDMFNKSTERRKQSYDQVGSTTSNAKMDEDDMHEFEEDEFVMYRDDEDDMPVFKKGEFYMDDEDDMCDEDGIDTTIPMPLFNEKVLLPNLAYLTIERCGSLEQVVREEEQRIQVSDQDNVIVFPQLREMQLKNLPKLRSFYPGNLTLEFPSLIKLSVEECPHMETFSPCHVVIPENTAVTAFYSRKGDRITQDLFKTEEEREEVKEKGEEETPGSSYLSKMSEKDEERE